MSTATLEALAGRELQQPHHPPRSIHEAIQFIAFVGPSGVGKNYWVTKLINWAESSNLAFGEMLTNTTRLLRPNQDYEYRQVDREEFLRQEAKGEFEWTVPVGEDLYGTLKSDLENAARTRHPWLIHVTHSTVGNLRRFAPGRVLSIFCHASIETIRHNLERRPNNASLPEHKVRQDIEQRLARAATEEQEARQSLQFNLVLNTDHRQRTDAAILEEILSYLREFPKPKLW